jgi:hypothetical protein
MVAARTTSAWIHPDDAQHALLDFLASKTSLAEEPAGVAIEGRLATASQEEEEK